MEGNILKYFYAKFRAIISRYSIKNSSYFLTVGDWSLNYFQTVYNLHKKKSFSIPGPVDKSLSEKKEFFISNEECRNKILTQYKLEKKRRRIVNFIRQTSKQSWILGCSSSM